MRRIVIIGTAVAVLVGAAAAFAVTNNYQGTGLSFPPGAGGSTSKPAGLGMVEKLQANAPTGERAAPLFNIKLKIYGVKLDQGKLPVCTDAKILANKSSPTGSCPKGSLIGSGLVNSLLGSGSNSSLSGGTACNPHLNVFNGGPKTEVFYFWTKTASDCAGLTTGSTAPYDGHISYQGKNAIINVPLPPDISTKVAGQPNFYGSLIKETLTFPKKVNGKGYMVGVGCQHGKRPWSITYKAQDYPPPNGSGNTETSTESGKASC